MIQWTVSTETVTFLAILQKFWPRWPQTRSIFCLLAKCNISKCYFRSTFFFDKYWQMRNNTEVMMSYERYWICYRWKFPIEFAAWFCFIFFQPHIEIGLCVPVQCPKEAITNWAQKYFEDNRFIPQRIYDINMTTVDSKVPEFKSEIFSSTGFILFT